MKNILLFLVFSITISISGISQEISQNLPQPTPDRIMLSFPGNPATQRAVTWRTSAEISKSIGQITEARATPFFDESIKNVEGTSTFWMDGNPSAMGHRVVFDNLKPKTMYLYRVGDGENWSEWFQFTTSSDTNKAFNFLYLGDFQNDIKQFCSRTIRQAYSHFPNSEFILFAGDIVSRSTEEYWSEFFYAGNWIFGTIPSLATPGNHEYDKMGENEPRTFSKHWNQIFTAPENHPKNLKGRTFYMDYQGVRFISVDSPALGNNKENAKNTLNWLNQVLKENPNKWTILFTHYPVYSCSQGRNNEEYRNAIKPILEKYGVDLVLQGHDHTYCRGQNLSNVGANCKNPPMYMVSVSGPKMYGLNINKWSDRVASQTQLYQNIEVTDKSIKVESYTVTGQLYDSFTLKKNKNGVNKVLEDKKLKSISEFNAIPETAIGRYSEEELNKYKSEY